MALILYCRACLEGLRFQGGEMPKHCTRCGFGKAEEDMRVWLTLEELPEPTQPYVVTPNDAKLLHSFRIDPELPPVVGTVES